MNDPCCICAIQNYSFSKSVRIYYPEIMTKKGCTYQIETWTSKLRYLGQNNQLGQKQPLVVLHEKAVLTSFALFIRKHL